MTTPLSQFDKPEASQYLGRRKLFLVPNFPFPPDVPDELKSLVDKYWMELRDHVNNLERSLGAVGHVFHEMLFADGEEGLDILEQLNPQGHPFIKTLCSSTATLEATEDGDILQENADWQRCLSIGLGSKKVLDLAMEGYQETTQKRFEHIGSRIDETLKENETGVLFIREDHRVQFPSDIQVFYVAPPALNDLKRWLNDQSQATQRAAESARQSTQSTQGEPAEQTEPVDSADDSESTEPAGQGETEQGNSEATS
ncbi:MAG: hypothetical protein IH861_12160 [Chloroflexi bacterium]|nr:hypothetical protein [Chloroflexota bacterium]